MVALHKDTNDLNFLNSNSHTFLATVYSLFIYMKSILYSLDISQILFLS